MKNINSIQLTAQDYYCCICGIYFKEELEREKCHLKPHQYKVKANK